MSDVKTIPLVSSVPNMLHFYARGPKKPECVEGNNEMKLISTLEKNGYISLYFLQGVGQLCRQ